jgi:hypothetical protein
MSRDSELAFHSRVTQLFIAANPSELVLTQAGMVKTASGGRVRSDGPTRPAQTFRLIDQSTSFGSTPGPVRTADGVSRRATHQLLGYRDAVFAVGDFWTGDDGRRYEIVEILPDNGYERRARVVAYG